MIHIRLNFKLFYCSSMWSSTTKKNIARLQKVQNFAARIVTGARKYEHITPMLKELHWLPVAKQLEVRDILMAFKCIKGLAPPSLCNKFSTRSQVHTRNTRNKDKLHMPSFRSATRVWMGLTDNWQMAENLTDNWHLPWVLLSADKGPDCPLFSTKPVFMASK